MNHVTHYFHMQMERLGKRGGCVASTNHPPQECSQAEQLSFHDPRWNAPFHAFPYVSSSIQLLCLWWFLKGMFYVE